MSSWYEQAQEKLKQGAKKVKGQREGAMKGPVKETLLDFCRQNEEFAQAVAQGGSFPECMTAVAKGVGSSISDLEAYKKAVSFYGEERRHPAGLLRLLVRGRQYGNALYS